ncbi:hypothetical protein LRS74_01015 [Streptomyces sp. LX-29]|uniref:hypothetical protein n=1 Tax=Streptomyces sp. LX-29 TaxID=2900152 RepID=UPI00240D3435|nr:hypothetical protein [Streptomyces sp. LX-29]WFB05753.1 hypothetical protein LRS74_01015 [Streptomyces sp. LX-29]
MISLDRRLIGSWFGPVVNVMESTDIVFLANGWGWSRLDSVSGMLAISRFRWSCPSEGVLRLRYAWLISGQADARDGFQAIDHNEPTDEIIETGYRITRQPPPFSQEMETALLVDQGIDYENTFYRGKGILTADDDPSAALVPYPPAPRPGPPGLWRAS